MTVSLHYYDLVIVAIAASMIAGVAIGLLTAVPIMIAVALFGLVAIAIVAHALFLNGPIQQPGDLTEPIEPQEIPGGERFERLVE